MVQEYPMKSSLIFAGIKSSGQLVLNLPAHMTLLSFVVALNTNRLKMRQSGIRMLCISRSQRGKG
ncbi:LOW QUALITY PROTEIN: hypothetical protein ACHAW5_002951 [Stephanodiscus triporus]|uniref:Uncharacterized protein n=1 Tax=Stephanodiscus triporus TaxID=2934178 RepID=A0ABD3NVB7_9STRA